MKINGFGSVRRRLGGDVRHLNKRFYDAERGSVRRRLGGDVRLRSRKPLRRQDLQAGFRNPGRSRPYFETFFAFPRRSSGNYSFRVSVLRVF